MISKSKCKFTLTSMSSTSVEISDDLFTLLRVRVGVGDVRRKRTGRIFNVGSSRKVSTFAGEDRNEDIRLECNPFETAGDGFVISPTKSVELVGGVESDDGYSVVAVRCKGESDWG